MSTRSTTRYRVGWQDRSLTKRDTINIRESLVDALAFNYTGDELPKMGMPVVKLVLPYLKALDPKWKEVSLRRFNKRNQKAHGTLYESLRSALKRPVTLLEEVRLRRAPSESEASESSSDLIDTEVEQTSHQHADSLSASHKDSVESLPQIDADVSAPLDSAGV